jgi:phenylacetate-coenzyme A ligase PaaK-like adenylate-forming protein
MNINDNICGFGRACVKYRRKLFMSGDIYNIQSADKTFIGAMKANIAFHTKKCPEYGQILKNLGFELDSVLNIEDLAKIPPLPASYLKNNSLLSTPYGKLFIKTTSSGSGGKKTLSGFDLSSALCGLMMALRVFGYHKMPSLGRTNYLILGYQPDKSNQTAMAKALRAVTLLAPAKKTVYAPTLDGGR